MCVVQFVSSQDGSTRLSSSSPWTQSPLFVIVVETVSRSLDSQPSLQLPSQRILALKSPLTTAPRTIQRAPTKLMQTPLPRTPSIHSLHPVPVGFTPTGDAAPLRQSSHPPRTPTSTLFSPAAWMPSKCPTRFFSPPSARTPHSPLSWRQTPPSQRARWRKERATCLRE